jgi:hypothetical protein
MTFLGNIRTKNQYSALRLFANSPAEVVGSHGEHHSQKRMGLCVPLREEARKDTDHKRIENVQQPFGFCLAGVAEGSHNELGAFGFA